MVDANRGFLRFDSKVSPLMKREDLIPRPIMTRTQENPESYPQSGKVVEVQLEKRCPVTNGQDILVDPQNVIVNDEGLAITRILSVCQEGCCVVQVINVT